MAYSIPALEEMDEGTNQYCTSFQEPELVNGVLEAIQSISDEARRALADPEISRENLLEALNVSYLSVSLLRMLLINEILLGFDR